MNGKMPKEISRMTGYFLVAFFFVSFSVGLGISDTFSRYRSGYTVIVLPQEGGTSLHEVAENVAFLSGTPAFRRSFFDELGAGPGAYEALSGKEEEAAFKEMVTVAVPEKGSLFSVAAYSDDRDDAMSLSRTAIDTLARFSEHYYNMRTDATFRIVEGPNVVRVTEHPFLFVLASAAIGFTVTGLFFAALSLLPGLFSLGKRSFRERALFRPDVFEPKKPADTFQETTETRETVLASPSIPNLSQDGISDVPLRSAPRSAPSKTGAPTNLPGIFSKEEEAFLREFSFVGEEKIVPEEPEATVEPASVLAGNAVPVPEEGPEPDEEEYKRRLNQLLKGKL
jgi:hypothetical protein